MATVTAVQAPHEEPGLSTIPDPRTRNVTQPEGQGSETPHHPDLSDEVATLSQKLVHSINLQETLDDSLSETRHDLEMARSRIQELDAIVASQKATLEGDVWVRRSNIEPEKELLRQRIRDVKREKAAAEAETNQMRDELERYSTQVMVEAQNMVVKAKTEFHERETQLQQKIDQLRGQVSDYEEMFKAQQEQLVELRETIDSQRNEAAGMKQAMDEMSEKLEEPQSCCPSTPGLSRTSAPDDETTAGSDDASNAECPVPVAPLSMTHLIQPALRDDVCVFTEFAELVEMAKRPKSSSHARVSSGGYSGFASLTMGIGGNPYVFSQENSSTASLPTSSTTATESNPHTPNTPASSVSAGSMASPRPTQPLQSTKFFKRIVDEDIEPTIRRSTSVINWVTKRNFSAACADGTLVIEPVLVDSPMARTVKPQYDPCSICGEESKAKEHLRMHRFGIGSEAKNPLCNYCLRRVRTSCELVTFLRMIRDGVWKVEGDDGLRAAWEECTRLREEIFWARIGGGVVPVQDARHSQTGSWRVSHYSTPVPPEPKETAEHVDDDTATQPTDKQTSPEDVEPGPIASEPIATTTNKLSSQPAVLRQRSGSAINTRPGTPSKSQSALKRLSLTIPIRAGFFS